MKPTKWVRSLSLTHLLRSILRSLLEHIYSLDQALWFVYPSILSLRWVPLLNFLFTFWWTFRFQLPLNFYFLTLDQYLTKIWKPSNFDSCFGPCGKVTSAGKTRIVGIIGQSRVQQIFNEILKMQTKTESIHFPMIRIICELWVRQNRTCPHPRYIVHICALKSQCWYNPRCMFNICARNAVLLSPKVALRLFWVVHWNAVNVGSAKNVESGYMPVVMIKYFAKFWNRCAPTDDLSIFKKCDPLSFKNAIEIWIFLILLIWWPSNHSRMYKQSRCISNALLKDPELGIPLSDPVIVQQTPGTSAFARSNILSAKDLRMLLAPAGQFSTACVNRAIMARNMCMILAACQFSSACVDFWHMRTFVAYWTIVTPVVRTFVVQRTCMTLKTFVVPVVKTFLAPAVIYCTRGHDMHHSMNTILSVWFFICVYFCLCGFCTSVCCMPDLLLDRSVLAARGIVWENSRFGHNWRDLVSTHA